MCIFFFNIFAIIAYFWGVISRPTKMWSFHVLFLLYRVSSGLVITTCFFCFFSSVKVVKLIGVGSVINGAYPV